MVVAVQQPLAECNAIFTVCIVAHRPPSCAVITHKTCQLNIGTDSKTVPASKTEGKCAGNTSNISILVMVLSYTEYIFVLCSLDEAWRSDLVASSNFDSQFNHKNPE